VIDKALGGNRSANPFFNHTDNFNHAVSITDASFDSIANPDSAGRLARHVVDPHFAATASIRRRHTVLEQANRDKPTIDPRRFHQSILSGEANNGLDRQGKRSVNQPDHAVAQLDWICLERSGTSSRLDRSSQRLELALRASDHLAAVDVE